jgi:hypothetical protein
MQKEFLYGLLLAIGYIIILYITSQTRTIESFADTNLLKDYIDTTASLVSLTGRMTNGLSASNVILKPFAVMNDMQDNNDPKLCISIENKEGEGNTLTPDEKSKLIDYAKMSPDQVNDLTELCLEPDIIKNAATLHSKYKNMFTDLNYVDQTVNEVNNWKQGINGKLINYLDSNFYTNALLESKDEMDSNYEKTIQKPLTRQVADAKYYKKINGQPVTQNTGDKLYELKQPNKVLLSLQDANKYFLPKAPPKDSYVIKSYLDEEIDALEEDIIESFDTMQYILDPKRFYL